MDSTEAKRRTLRAIADGAGSISQLRLICPTVNMMIFHLADYSREGLIRAVQDRYEVTEAGAQWLRDNEPLAERKGDRLVELKQGRKSR